MKQSRTKSLATNITNIRTIPKNMPTNFQLKRLKLKLDIVEKPENRVHKQTDSNGSREIVGVLSLEILRLIGEIRNPNPSWDLVTRNLTANW